MTLSKDLEATVEAVRSAVPPTIFHAIGKSIADLKATSLVAHAAKVGSRVTLPKLPDGDGKTLDLAQLAAQGPLVIVFYRGGWCPYCNVALRAYQTALPDFTAKGAKIVAITPEDPAHATSTSEKNGITIPVLIDKGNAFARSLGLVFALPPDLRPQYRSIGIDLEAWNGDDSHELPLPATYVIDQNRTIRWAWLEEDFTKRADPRDVVAALPSA